MAGYGSVIAYARLLENSEAAELLEETLKEEKAADRKLTELSENINEQANDDAEGPSDDQQVRGKRGAKRAA
jgi:ferritin-like metal-binding protein YciE